MKLWQNKKIALIMTLILIVPFLCNLNTAVASAATPTFVQQSAEIVGAGGTYQLQIKDEVAKSKYSWTSSDPNIATVTNKGLVTSVNKGTVTIKCKITYPTKKTKTLSCKVTVTIPAKEIAITNAKDVNGAHVMLLGEKMDFESLLTPVNSSDKVYWFVSGGDAGCIRMDDAINGIVTATKAGKVILTAAAAKTASKEAADLSLVRDSIIIEVTGPTASVLSADIKESNRITVEFDSPVLQGTVIGLNNALSDNIEVTMGKDAKGNVAGDPGKLTASLSTEGKTLTITSEKSFKGYYGINFTDKIITTDGTPLKAEYRRLNYIDVTPPAYAGTTLDDTGMIATVTFTEPVNFDHMAISDVKLITTSGETASTATLGTLKNVYNYTVSTDKRSLTIDLTGINFLDKGKLFSVIITGITDMAGNVPAKVYVETFVSTDTSLKPQANLISVQRTGYKTITATFDRAISFGGYATIENGSNMFGLPDSSDTKKVNYTISDAEALYTGVKKVSIGFWNSYNVNPNDNTASKTYEFPVDFTPDKTSPIIISKSFDPDKKILTLTYNEDVTLTAASGVFSSTFTSISEDRINMNLGYTAITHTDGKKVIKLQMTNMSLAGIYSFDFVQGFVTDNFQNLSVKGSMVINVNGSTSTELPIPYSIAQSSDNLSEIIIRFRNKLDTASAENTANYQITGISILKAELKENSADGAAVKLTVADSSIAYSMDYPMTISGVKGYNNSYSAITSYSPFVTLKENTRPTYVPNPVFDKVNKNNIRINFTEAIQGTISLKVTQQVGSSLVENYSTVTIDGSSVVIHLTNIPNNNTSLFIDIVSFDIKDMNGNALLSMPPRLPVLITY